MGLIISNANKPPAVGGFEPYIEGSIHKDWKGKFQWDMGKHLCCQRRLNGIHRVRFNGNANSPDVSEEEAEKRMILIDKEQREFFKTMYDKKDAVPYEFALVINMDFIPDAKKAANIIASAFNQKFGDTKD